jgi:uncharacterized protein with HEPN domain
MVAAAAGLAEIFTLGRDRFLSDQLLQDAAVRRLEVLGEAAGAVSETVRRKHPAVPWRPMRGFASFSKHEYWRVDPLRLWSILETVNRLRPEIAAVRAERAR